MLDPAVKQVAGVEVQWGGHVLTKMARSPYWLTGHWPASNWRRCGG